MDDQFYLFSEYQDDGYEARHFICGDYHLWIWSDDDGTVVKFEFHYKDRIVKYADGAFSRVSENYILPVFFLVEQLFTCDNGLQSSLLALRDEYVAGSQSPSRGDSEKGLRAAI